MKLLDNLGGAFYLQNLGSASGIGTHNVFLSTLGTLRIANGAAPGANVPASPAVLAAGNDGNNALSAAHGNLVTYVSTQGSGTGGGPAYGELATYDYATNTPFNLILNSNGGNVGIGTTSPAAKLAIADSLTYGTATADSLYLSPLLTGGNPANPTSLGGVLWKAGSFNAIRLNPVLDSPQSYARAHLEFWTHNGTTFAERMRLAYDGSIGIGTTAPGAALDVAGKAFFGSTAGGGVLALKPGSVDHTFLEFYARTSSPASRSGYLGYSAGTSPHLEMVNQLTGGSLFFASVGVVRWTIDSNGQLLPYTSNAYDIGSNSARIRSLYLSGTLVAGNSALSTAATDGFLYIPSMNGAPTGTPTTYGGTVPLVYDTANNQLCLYNGAWKKVALS
ncbi:MAG TPA: hypothetical protein VK633_12630 [Verrucomicrobiae bacterium]|nr:hypothetical protein [Verrucomicrobiae bacterium]